MSRCMMGVCRHEADRRVTFLETDDRLDLCGSCTDLLRVVAAGDLVVVPLDAVVLGGRR